MFDILLIAFVVIAMLAAVAIGIVLAVAAELQAAAKAETDDFGTLDDTDRIYLDAELGPGR